MGQTLVWNFPRIPGLESPAIIKLNHLILLVTDILLCQIVPRISHLINGKIGVINEVKQILLQNKG